MKLFYGMHAALTLRGNQYAAWQDIDTLVIYTEWLQLHEPDVTEMAMRMGSKFILDGRNLHKP